jgi:16S rRNA (uracil1498-N3)-methyltransferase
VPPGGPAPGGPAPDGPVTEAWPPASAAAQVFVADLDAPSLDEDDAHHLGRVLRLRPGEHVVAADGRGGWRSCRYVDRAGAAGLEADGERRLQPAPAAPVVVGFVPVKGTRPEWVVQKLTEVGVDRIAVVRSARSVVEWEGDRRDRALLRLRRVARGAAAQSRRARLPEVLDAGDLAALAAQLTPTTLALADMSGQAPSADVRALAVGPEGGWSDEERAGAALVVRLGTGVLRAETAAVGAGVVLCGLRDGLLGAP